MNISGAAMQQWTATSEIEHSKKMLQMRRRLHLRLNGKEADAAVTAVKPKDFSVSDTELVEISEPNEQPEDSEWT